jgi:hypothetical protein
MFATCGHRTGSDKAARIHRIFHANDFNRIAPAAAEGAGLGSASQTIRKWRMEGLRIGTETPSGWLYSTLDITEISMIYAFTALGLLLVDAISRAHGERPRLAMILKTRLEVGYFLPGLVYVSERWLFAYAIDAAGSNGVEAFKSLLDAFAVDAGLFNQGFDSVTLANSKLWPGRVPAWALDTWKELNSDLLSANEDWGVWTSWYEQRLRADTTTQDTEIARVTIDDRIWGSGVKALNAHLKELLTSAEFLKTHWPMTWKIRHKLTQFPNRQLPRAGLQSTRKDASIS